MYSIDVHRVQKGLEASGRVRMIFGLGASGCAAFVARGCRLSTRTLARGRHGFGFKDIVYSSLGFRSFRDWGLRASSGVVGASGTKIRVVRLTEVSFGVHQQVRHSDNKGRKGEGDPPML